MRTYLISAIYLGISIFIVVGISGFSHWRNGQRNFSKVEIDFKGASYYLNDSAVNKLLIQKETTAFFKKRDTLDLKTVEAYFETLPVVENAEVYQFPEGILGITIKERRPLFRVEGKASFYVDAFGIVFPLSNKHSFYVPVFLGDFTEQKKDEIMELVTAFLKDDYLSKELSHLYIKENDYVIGLRSFDFEIVLGNANELTSKLQKVKAFCAYQQVQEVPKAFSQINLKYKNQVVATL